MSAGWLGQIVVLIAPIMLLAGVMLPRAVGEVGEFSIPAVQPLNEAQREALRKLVDEDAEAEALADQVRREAEPLLDIEPTPLKEIHYEGLVNTDPRRIDTVAKLKQMGDAARLMRYWQTTGDERAASALKRLILAWTETYALTGNDVNENKFQPLLVAYLAMREDFESEQRRRVDRWVRQLGELHAEAVARSDHFTNRYVKHVRLTAMAGLILERDEWVAAAHEGVKRFVRESLRADGSSYDLEHRDTLTYHGSALKPAIELAMIVGGEGRDLYTWQSDEGGSLKKSVDFVVPYAMGEKTHREWVDSKVALDRRRAEAGLEKYRPGRRYERKSALELMELASYFDADLMRVVHHLHDGDAERFPTWQTLVNAAARAGADQAGDSDDAADRGDGSRNER